MPRKNTVCFCILELHHYSHILNGYLQLLKSPPACTKPNVNAFTSRKKVIHCWKTLLRQETHLRHILCPFRMGKSTNIRLLENHDMKSCFKFPNNLNSYLDDGPINTQLLSFCLKNCMEREAAYVFSALRLALVQKSTPHLLNLTGTSPLFSHSFILMQMCNVTFFFPIFPLVSTQTVLISSFSTDNTLQRCFTTPLYNKKTCKVTAPRGCSSYTLLVGLALWSGRGLSSLQCEIPAVISGSELPQMLGPNLWPWHVRGRRRLQRSRSPFFLLRGQTKYTQAILVRGTSKNAQYTWVIPSSPASTAVTLCARVSKQNSRTWRSGVAGGILVISVCPCTHSCSQSADVLTGEEGAALLRLRGEERHSSVGLWPTQLPQTTIRAKELNKGGHAGTAHRWGVCTCLIRSCTGMAGIPPLPQLTSFKAYN